MMVVANKGEEGTEGEQKKLYIFFLNVEKFYVFFCHLAFVFMLPATE